MEYGLLGLLVLIADIYAIYRVLTSGASGLAKLIWTLVILILPVLGFIAWLIAGPRGSGYVEIVLQVTPLQHRLTQVRRQNVGGRQRTGSLTSFLND